MMECVPELRDFLLLIVHCFPPSSELGCGFLETALHVTRTVLLIAERQGIWLIWELVLFKSFCMMCSKEDGGSRCKLNLRRQGERKDRLQSACEEQAE